MSITKPVLCSLYFVLCSLARLAQFHSSSPKQAKNKEQRTKGQSLFCTSLLQEFFNLLVAFADGDDKWSKTVILFQIGIGALLKQQLDRLGMTFPCCFGQRRAAVRVSRIHICAFIQKTLYGFVVAGARGVN